MMQQMLLGYGPSGVSIEDVFSVDTYTGNGGTGQTITNGIDLYGEGGFVWIKNRGAGDHYLQSSVFTSIALSVSPNTTDGYRNHGSMITAWNSSGGGFQLGSNNYVNDYGSDFVAWTFRKAPGFCDVFSYNGNGASNRVISHNLGETPGLVLIKEWLGNGYDWMVWHKDLTSISYHDKLNLFGSQSTNPSMLDAAPTANDITVSNTSSVNNSSGKYFCAVFPNNDLVKCDKYTGNNQQSQSINVGFEPQWVLIKNITRSEDWVLVDANRLGTNSTSNFLFSNKSVAESVEAAGVTLTSTGFNLGGRNITNYANDTFIYMAIAAP